MDGTCQPEHVTDVVSAGSEPVSRRTRGTVAALVVLALLGLGADRWAADRERDRLADAVAAGEQVVADAEASLVTLRAYISPSAERPDLPVAERARAYGPVGRDAERWLPRVQQRLADVRAVDALPWHDELAQGRDAYAARLQEVADLLAAVARTPAEPAGAPGRTAELRESADAALRAVGVELPR